MFPSVVGIRLAEVSSMPKEVIDEAKDLSVRIAESNRVSNYRLDLSFSFCKLIMQYHFFRYVSRRVLDP